jgi:RNA polymerase sigma-70 factor (ECF subfamily)
MDAAQRQVFEAEIRRRWEAGDLDGAMTEALRGYGPELFGLLNGLARNPDVAAEIFSEVCERLWKNFRDFRWDASFRVWAYAVSRNTFYHSMRDRGRKPKAVGISEVPSIAAVVKEVRSATPIHQRTEVKDAFAKLRETLEPDDVMLLALRVERDLPWNEIAEILEIEAPALRKRFQRLKQRLRELAEEAGIDGG